MSDKTPADALSDPAGSPSAIVERNWFQRNWQAATAVSALAVVLTGTALWPDGSGERQAKADTPVDAAGLPGDASEVTDADLRKLDASDYNCGGKLQKPNKEGHYSVDYAINYYNSKPKLGQEMDDFHTATLGGGFDILLNHGYANTDTTEGKHFAGNVKIDKLLHLRARAELAEERVYANFSCEQDGEINVHRATKKPTIAIQPGSHVEGVLLDEEGLKAFKENVKRNEDGSMPVDVVDTGDHKIGNETKQLWLVVLYADGCDNPVLRLQPPKKVKPTTPTSTILPSGGLTPSPTHTVTFGKTDDGLPSKRPGRGVPGDPGEGDAGQSRGPDGHIPGDNRPTQEPYPTPRPTPRPTPGPEKTGDPQPETSPVIVVTTEPQPTATEPSEKPN